MELQKSHYGATGTSSFKRFVSECKSMPQCHKMLLHNGLVTKASTDWTHCSPVFKDWMYTQTNHNSTTHRCSYVAAAVEGRREGEAGGRRREVMEQQRSFIAVIVHRRSQIIFSLHPLEEI